MFVELVYDKRNFDGLPGAKDIILGELTKSWLHSDLRRIRKEKETNKAVCALGLWVEDCDLGFKKLLKKVKCLQIAPFQQPSRRESLE